MLGYLIVLGAIVSMVLSSSAKKCFKKQCTIFFTAVCCLFADLVFIFSSGFKLDFNLQVLPYSLLFSLTYASACLFATYAYKVGSYSYTGLCVSYSLLIPTLFGIFFLNESTNLFFYLGLLFLCVAIYLFAGIKKEPKPVDGIKKNNFNVKWLIFATIVFITNGFCAVIQTEQQNAFNGLYKNEFMIVSLTIVSVFLFVLSLFLEKGKIKDGIKQSFGFGFIAGFFNGWVNLFILIAVNYLNASIVFPLISGGGLKENYNLKKIYIVWLQGESDALNFTGTENYLQMLIQLKNDIKSEIEFDKFAIIRQGYFAEFAPWIKKPVKDKKKSDKEIMKALDLAPKKDGDFYMLTKVCAKLSKDKRFLNDKEYGPHYNNKGMEIIGNKAGNQLAKIRRRNGKLIKEI